FKQLDIPERVVQSQLRSLNVKIDNYEESKSARVRPLGIQVPQRKSHFLRYASAAIIALTIGIIAIVYNNSPVQKVKQVAYGSIHVPFGKHELIKLADGSEIILNANSDLRYPLKTGKKQSLDIWLSGEAYFSVVHNPNGIHRIFRVHTNDGIIRDIGTRFDVNTRNNTTRVILVEGEVELEPSRTNNGNPRYVRMKPGEMASFSISDPAVSLVQVNTEVYTSWIHNKLVFDNTPLDEAIQSIENYYGVKIEVTSQDVLKQRISGTIRNTDLATVLKGLSNILGLKIEHKDNIILLNK
ncbi:MAG TPA: FecR domain-containing protein, partial [Balneolales bacterium]|nr:FecR domain-containing protein [Balneolales bacterium]